MPAPLLPLEVIVTPRFDVFYALHTLASTAPTPLDRWKEAAIARLPRDFMRRARRVAPVPIFWPLLADALKNSPGVLPLDEILTTLRAASPKTLRANVLGGIFHDRPTVEALVGRKKTLGDVLGAEKRADAGLLEHFGLRPYRPDSPAAHAVSSLISDTTAYRDEVGAVLHDFLESGFRADWSQLEPTLLREADALKVRSEEASIGELAAELELPVRFDESSGALQARSGAGIALTQVDRCYLLPSPFNSRRWWAKYDTGERITLYFPVWSGPTANALVSADRTKRPSPDQARMRPRRLNPEVVFRALGDTTRYAIASILARKPTSSADLARSLKLSKPTITHHVQALRAAGLIEETADGGSSRLSLNRETLAALSAAVIADLFASSGELPLLTTRQRRSG